MLWMGWLMRPSPHVLFPRGVSAPGPGIVAGRSQPCNGRVSIPLPYDSGCTPDGPANSGRQNAAPDDVTLQEANALRGVGVGACRGTGFGCELRLSVCLSPIGLVLIGDHSNYVYLRLGDTTAQRVHLLPLAKCNQTQPFATGDEAALEQACAPPFQTMYGRPYRSEGQNPRGGRVRL
jgi:hypothetical protein